MAHQPGQSGGVHLAGECELAAGIVRALAVAFHPFVDRPVGRAGVAGDQGAVGETGGDVGHAAEVQDDRRLAAETGHQGAVIGRCQRRALTARLDIGRAEVTHQRHAHRLAQAEGIDQLQGRAFLAGGRAPVQHGLPVDAGQQRDRGPGGRGQQHPGFVVRPGDHLQSRPERRFRDRPRPVPGPGGVGRGLQDRALLRRILAFYRRAKVGDLLPVRQDHGGVHRVQRGAGHEAGDPDRGGGGRCFFRSRVQAQTFPC